MGSSYFARHYFRNRFYFLFLWVLRCFSSPRSPLYTTLLIYRYTVSFYCMSSLIRTSTDIMDICSSPWLFAAYHVLLRLLVPRHSPYALCSLTYFSLIFLRLWFFFIVNNFSMFNIVSLFIFGWIVILKYTFSYVFQYASLPFLLSLYNFQCTSSYKNIRSWWAQMESNHRPHAYQACALTIWAMSPY